MSAVLLPQGKQQYITAAGIPLVGGRVRTFDTGTSTPRLTWSDAAQTSPNTNPVILDARGEATIFWSGAYRVTVEDSLGNVIWTQDGVSDQGFSDIQLRTDLAVSNDGSKGAGMVGYTFNTAYAASTVGSFLNTMYGGVGDVLLYGAVGNGSVAGGTGTNDAAAFTAAAAAGVAAGVPVVASHGKIYRITGNLTLSTGLMVAGAQISIDAGATLTLNGPLLTINSPTPFVGPGFVVYNTTGARPGRLNTIVPDRAAGVPVRGGQQVHLYGDSFTAGNAAGALLCFSAIFSSRINGVENNHGISGRGVTRATYEAFGTLPLYGARSMVITHMAGFNDLHYQLGNPKTLVKLTSEAKAFLANAFLKSAVPASDAAAVKVGAWLNAGPPGIWAEKARYFPGPGSPMYSVTVGNTITYAFTGTNVVVFHWQGSNAIYTLAPIEVRIDGVLVETLLPNNTTDGNAGFPEVYENLTHAVAYYPNLGSGAHTIEFRHAGAAGNLLPLDCFGVLASPGDCPSVLMTEIPHVNAAGYAGPEAGRSKTIDNNGSAALRAGLEVFRVQGYPVAWVPVNDYYDYQANIFSDNDHPAVAGHAQIAGALASYCQPQNYAVDPSATFLKAATQAIVSGAAAAAVTFSSALDDRFGFRDAANTSRFVAPFTGTMRLTGVIAFAASLVGSRDAGVYLNGGALTALIGGTAGSGVDTVIPVSGVSFPVVAGDYAEIKVTQNSGGNLNLQTTCRITAEMVR